MDKNLPYFSMYIAKTFEVTHEIKVNNKLHIMYTNIITDQVLVIRIYNMCTLESNNKKMLPHRMKCFVHVSSLRLKTPNSPFCFFIRNVPILFILYVETDVTTVRTADDCQCIFLSLKVYSKIMNFNVVE